MSLVCHFEKSLLKCTTDTFGCYISCTLLPLKNAYFPPKTMEGGGNLCFGYRYPYPQTKYENLSQNRQLLRRAFDGKGGRLKPQQFKL